MRIRRWAGIAAALALACSTAGPAAGDEPTSAAARADFDQAFGRLKKLMADLTVLQAQYQQPKADKAAIEATFLKTRTEAEAAGGQLEAAAVALLAEEPDDRPAREIASGVMAGALQGDDPEKTLTVAAALDQAGASDATTGLLAASAAVVLSRLDEADAWLEKAAAAKAPAEQISQLRAKVAGDRPKVEAEMAKRKAEAEADDLPRVKLTTSAGDLTVELFENEAPNTVANFLTLVEKGFYNATPFHRVIGGFMAQGGDPTGTGSGGPGHAIACECGAPEARLHFRGTLSMAHAGPDTGGSQFFLTFRPTEHLDGKHTVFGRVIAGDDVLAKIVRTQDAEGRPVPGVEPDRIIRAEVLRKRDHPYEPQTLPDPRR